MNVAANGWGNISNLTADSGGNLYGWDKYDRSLVSIDKATGIETNVGYAGIYPYQFGLSFDANDNLYLIEYYSPQVYSVNTSTGATTSISDISTYSGLHHGDFNPANNLYYGIDRTYDPRSLRVVDMSTLTIVDLIPTVNGLHTLAFVKPQDLDDDGVLNVDDNCITTYNPDQSDADGDGAGDVCDTCPDVYNPEQDEEVACITLAAEGVTCMESQVQLINDPGSILGSVDVKSLETVVVEYTQEEYGDQVSDNLKIARGWRRGVFNAGTDEIEWAVGTAAAPTSTWYNDFEEFLQDHFRQFVDVNLPGSDTVLHNITTGEYYDIHWDGWSRRSAGGFSYTRVHTTTSDTFSYAEADYTGLAPQTVDQISPGLGIRRSGTGGLYNANSDQTRWARGTVSGGPTSAWYTNHRDFLRNEIRPLNGNAGNHLNLPGEDTILHNVTTDEYYDIHWNYWSQGGSGGFSYTRTGVNRTVVASESFSDSALPSGIDISALLAGEYEFCVAGQAFVAPTTVVFEQPGHGDQISENLLVYRPTRGALASVGTDQTRWATGTAVVPASGWYNQFWELLRYEVRYNSSNPNCNGSNSDCLPFTPIVLHNMTTGQYYNIDFHYWTAGGDTFSYTRVETVTGETVLYNESALPATVDTITPELRITRNTSSGVYNLGTHQVLWAAGTTAAQTTSFMDFDALLRTHFRNMPGRVPVNLPGSDTVLWDIVDNTYYDVHWISWASGGHQGGFSYTRTGPYIATDDVAQDCTPFSKTNEDHIVINGSCNQPPILTLDAPSVTVLEGSPAANSGTVIDPDGDTPVLSVNVGVLDVVGPNWSWSLTPDDGPFETQTVTITADDLNGGVSQVSFLLTVNNVPPNGTLVAPSPVDEGSGYNLSLAAVTDPSGADTGAGFEFAFDCGDGLGYNLFNPVNGVACPAATDDTVRNAGSQVKDKDNGVGSRLADITIVNVAPTITGLSGPTEPLALGASATIEVDYTDPGVGDTHECTFSWDDDPGNPTERTLAGSGAGTGQCSDTFEFLSAGVYTVTVTVTDDDGGFDTKAFEFVVVYDPSAGFVTGGGQIQSAPGSYRPDESLEGVAHFGFVSKYKKGASTPVGQTEFQFQVADFNFHSTSYDWLVIAGTKAQYKGEGTVNGQFGSDGVSGYSFLLTATDGNAKKGGDGIDKFRIKISDKSAGGGVVYDNKHGVSEDIDSADPQAILHGSIVVHTKKKK